MGIEQLDFTFDSRFIIVFTKTLSFFRTNSTATSPEVSAFQKSMKIQRSDFERTASVH